jgi:hypothetical protein
LILVVLGGVAFLFPLGIYCVILARLNRSWHPTMIPGPWDFAGVLFALSGFLFVGGPALLTGFNKQWRQLWLHGDSGVLNARSTDWWNFWIALWGGYFVIVVGGAAYLLWQRRQSTAIYNIEPHQLDDALAQVLSRLDLPATRVANRYYINPGIRGAAGKSPHAEAIQAPGALHPAGELRITTEDAPALPDPMDAARPRPPREGILVLDVDVFATLRHATLRWQGNAEMTRKEIEAELAKELGQVQGPDSPIGGWLLTIAVSLLAIVSVSLVLLVLYVVLVVSKTAAFH